MIEGIKQNTCVTTVLHTLTTLKVLSLHNNCIALRYHRSYKAEEKFNARSTVSIMIIGTYNFFSTEGLHLQLNTIAKQLPTGSSLNFHEATFLATHTNTNTIISNSKKPSEKQTYQWNRNVETSTFPPLNNHNPNSINTNHIEDIVRKILLQQKGATQQEIIEKQIVTIDKNHTYTIPDELQNKLALYEEETTKWFSLTKDLENRFLELEAKTTHYSSVFETQTTNFQSLMEKCDILINRPNQSAATEERFNKLMSKCDELIQSQRNITVDTDTINYKKTRNHKKTASGLDNTSEGDTNV